MSGQWEVVSKKKDRGSKLPVPKVNDNKAVKSKNKKNDLNGVKIEEVLPKSQVQNLYSSNKNNKENKKLQEKNKPQEKGDKKSLKKEKPQDTPKPKPPKSIESALNLVDIDEFESIFEESKDHYPDAPIVWLKELVQFLNQKVPIEVHDPVFTSKPECYPLNVVPSGVKNIIEKSIREAGKNNAQLFFDICLTSMVTDMGKGLPALGYKFFLQYIAINEPKLIVANINKHVALRNSYQNRPNIGLSILWAVGYVGVNDLHSGLTAFEELYLPLLDMKNYSRFVVKYLLDLLNRHQDGTLSKEEYLLILDTIYSNKKNFPSDLKQQLSKKTLLLTPLLFKNNKEKYHGYIDVLLKKIVTNSNKPYQVCLCDVLVEIFMTDPTTLASWNKSYVKNVAASAVLLDYIGNNWKSISKRISKSAVTDLLTSFKVINSELSLKKRKEEGLKESEAAIKKIDEKMVAKKSSGFPFKSLSFLIVLVIAGFVYLDVKQHGSWKESRTSITLREYGVCEYAHRVIEIAKEGWTWVDDSIERYIPGYHKTIADFSAPYIQLFSELGKLSCNMFHNIKEVAVEKYPVVTQTIESYAPGLIEQSHKAVNNVYSTSILYYNRSVDYLKKEVFIGQLSPENVQRVVIEAFNSTQQKATEYYHWIYEKVQTSIK